MNACHGLTKECHHEAGPTSFASLHLAQPTYPPKIIASSYRTHYQCAQASNDSHLLPTSRSSRDETIREPRHDIATFQQRGQDAGASFQSAQDHRSKTSLDVHKQSPSLASDSHPLSLELPNLPQNVSIRSQLPHGPRVFPLAFTPSPAIHPRAFQQPGRLEHSFAAQLEKAGETTDSGRDGSRTEADWAAIDEIPLRVVEFRNGCGTSSNIACRWTASYETAKKGNTVSRRTVGDGAVGA